MLVDKAEKISETQRRVSARARYVDRVREEAGVTANATPGDRQMFVIHLIHRLAVGGLENALVNLVNFSPPDRYRHAIVCMTDYTDFRDRIRRPNVPVIALHKREGQDFGTYWRLKRLLSRLRPDIVHTRTFGALEGQIYAALAGVPGRVHGEHGRNMEDLDGSNLKHNLLRRAIRPLVHHYTTVSQDLAHWLISQVGAPADRVTQIYNGVDTGRFHPREGRRGNLGSDGFAPEEAFVVGTVGRMQPVKDQPMLVRAFLRLLDTVPDARKRLRLVLIGDGPLRAQAKGLLEAADAGDLAWLPGERSDIPEMLRAMDLFVLPSLGEGASNTILEAMASGLPVVATRVGGNPELVEEGCTGILTPPADPIGMAGAIRAYLDNPARATRNGRNARERAETKFSLEAMVNGYTSVYDTVMKGHWGARDREPATSVPVS